MAKTYLIEERPSADYVNARGEHPPGSTCIARAWEFETFHEADRERRARQKMFGGTRGMVLRVTSERPEGFTFPSDTAAT